MSTNEDAELVTRRGFVKAAAGATAAAAGTSAAGTAAAQGSAEVLVGPGGDYVYTPGTEDPLYIAPGTEVTFTWESDNHNIVVSSQPDGANWEGHEPIENTGFTYSHTFETLGEYEYFCQPHQNLGMSATIVVNEAGAPPDTGGGGGPTLPDQAKTIGVATMAAMVSTLAFAWFFIKYGGDYETPE